MLEIRRVFTFFKIAGGPSPDKPKRKEKKSPPKDPTDADDDEERRKREEICKELFHVREKISKRLIKVPAPPPSYVLFLLCSSSYLFPTQLLPSSRFYSAPALPCFCSSFCSCFCS